MEMGSGDGKGEETFSNNNGHKDVANKLKEDEITEQDSVLLIENLLQMAIFNISYFRGLFPEKYFNDKCVPTLEMNIKKVMPIDVESCKLIDWMGEEKKFKKLMPVAIESCRLIDCIGEAVYDALQKKYLKTLLFCVCEAIDGPMIEEYAFSFSYSTSDSQEVSMNINRNGNKKAGTVKSSSTTDITPDQMRSSACKMVRTLVQLMRTMDKMPNERIILMKLFYYEDVTPADYEPPFLQGCSEEDWTITPLKMEVGNIHNKHFVLALKVKSVPDPREDKNDENQDNLSLPVYSALRDEDISSDSFASNSDDDCFVVALAGKQQEKDNNALVDDENTQDPLEYEQQFIRVKDRISSHNGGTLPKGICSNEVVFSFEAERAAYEHQRCRSFTSILAMYDKECVLIAVDSRESKEKGTTVVPTNEKRDKLVEVRPTIFLAGTGVCDFIDKIGAEVRNHFQAKDRVQAKDIHMDMIAQNVMSIMSDFCLQQVDLKKEENAVDFALVGTTQCSAGIYQYRTINGKLKLDKSHITLGSGPEEKKFITLGSGTTPMEQYLKTNKDVVFRNEMERVDYCKNCIEFAANEDEDRTGGEFINVVRLPKGESSSRHDRKKPIDDRKKPIRYRYTYKKDEPKKKRAKDYPKDDPKKITYELTDRHVLFLKNT